MKEKMDSYTFGSDNAAIAMSESLNKFDNWKFKKAFVRAVQNFDTHLSNLYTANMDRHSKAYFLEQVLPNVITSFNKIRDNYRGKAGAYHMNFACGKAVGHFRYKINVYRQEVIKEVPFVLE
jgi:hypothetical protein